MRNRALRCSIVIARRGSNSFLEKDSLVFLAVRRTCREEQQLQRYEIGALYNWVPAPPAGTSSPSGYV